MAAAAGAATAIKASGRTGSVTVLEKMPRPGRKVMITGKGRCNFTNMKDWESFSTHVHPKSNLLKPAFFSMPPVKTVEWLGSTGLEPVLERGDRVFPASHRSADVVDALVTAVKNAGAKILTGCEAEDISVRKPAGEEQFFEIRCKGGQTFTCRRLIIATGGLSYPSTGSSGDGYRWAEETGHKISRRFPSLTAIVPRNYKSIPSGKDTRNAAESIHGHIDRSVPMSETGTLLNGNSLENISLTLWIDGNPVQEEFGDLDFTDGGIEGPVGFKVSRRCVNAIINGAKAAVSIDMKPAVRQEALEARVSKLWNEISEDRRSKGKQYKDKFRVLSGKLLPASLIPGFMKCNPGTNHKNIARALKAWKFDIAGFVGYERCVVTAGGVSAESVIAKTLESRLCSGLYFAGEVLDLDGDTGGYNLQIAFSTGNLAGSSAARSLL